MEPIKDLNRGEAAKLLEDLSIEIQNVGLDGKILATLQILREQVDNYKSIDQDMVLTLKNFLGDDLVGKDSYNDLVKSVEEGSVVVYFKSAQLFKIYKKEELNSLLGGQLRTVYKQFNHSYEVVPNESKQKIIIMGEASLIESFDKLQGHIMTFMREKGIEDFKSDDIVCFRDGNVMEIIINNYYVSNSSERDAIVTDLLKYVSQKEKNFNISGKIRPLNVGYSELSGADMIAMPNEKELITKKFVEYVDSLVGNVEKCIKINKEGNTYIINLNVQSAEVINNNNAEVINTADTINNVKTMNNTETINNSNVLEFGDFGKYILENLPEWYKPGKLVDKTLLQNKYEEQFGPISKPMFHKLFLGKIFGKSMRVTEKKVKITKVNLLDYKDILTLDN